MEHDPDEALSWARRMTADIGRNIAWWRKRRTNEFGVSMTAQELSDRCRELGHPLDRGVIAKLEKGHRHSITVPDLLVLASALAVPPVLLIAPVGQVEDVEVLPGHHVRAQDVVGWLAGVSPKPVTPEGADQGVMAAWWHHATAPLLSYLEHDDLVRSIAETRHELARLTMRRGKPGYSAKLIDERASRLANNVTYLEDTLRRHRRDMLADGLRPPSLASDLPDMADDVEEAQR